MTVLSEAYESFINWYWSSGTERNSHCLEQGHHAYELSPSTWAWQLYEGRRKARISETGMLRNKPALAIWGPSQVGNSTLLVRYLDGGGARKGRIELPADLTGPSTT